MRVRSLILGASSKAPCQIVSDELRLQAAKLYLDRMSFCHTGRLPGITPRMAIRRFVFAGNRRQMHKRRFPVHLSPARFPDALNFIHSSRDRPLTLGARLATIAPIV